MTAALIIAAGLVIFWPALVALLLWIVNRALVIDRWPAVLVILIYGAVVMTGCIGLRLVELALAHAGMT